MIHAICDFCGKDCDLSATLLSLTPFQNFARHHNSTEPYGARGETRSFCICHDCMVGHKLPNPYGTYDTITRQALRYEKTVDGFTADDCKQELNDRFGTGAVPGHPETVRAEPAPAVGGGAASHSDGGDLDEFVGQLMDACEDAIGDVTGHPEQTYLHGARYGRLASRIRGTLTNWGMSLHPKQEDDSTGN